MGVVWRKARTLGGIFFAVWMSACAPNWTESGTVNETAPLAMTFTPTCQVSPVSSKPPQFFPNPTATSSVIPTSTPWPTVDPTLYATFYLTPTFAFTPTPNYYAQMRSLYRLMIGEWWGTMGVSVSRQARRAHYSIVVFYERCEMGQVCGRYHFENGCFGELVLNNWRHTFLVFRNLEYSGKTVCKNWNPMNVRPLSSEQLSFTFAYRNEEGEKVNKGVVLRRK